MPRHHSIRHAASRSSPLSRLRMRVHGILHLTVSTTAIALTRLAGHLQTARSRRVRRGHLTLQDPPRKEDEAARSARANIDWTVTMVYHAHHRLQDILVLLRWPGLQQMRKSLLRPSKCRGWWLTNRWEIFTLLLSMWAQTPRILATSHPRPSKSQSHELATGFFEKLK